MSVCSTNSTSARTCSPSGTSTAGLYAGTPFYGTPKKIYNQTAVTYNRRFFNNTVGVSAGFYFHYDGVGLGLQQILKVSVNLQKTVYRPKK